MYTSSRRNCCGTIVAVPGAARITNDGDATSEALPTTTDAGRTTVTVSGVAMSHAAAPGPPSMMVTAVSSTRFTAVQ